LQKISNVGMCLPQDQRLFHFRSAPFILKPFYPAQIERVLQAVAD
jgi:hypothetical protein